MYTPEQEEEYVANSGQFCPNCGSGQIEGEEWNADGGTANQQVLCLNCGERWYDVYELVGAQQIDKGRG